jgi:hypothetical protein
MLTESDCVDCWEPLTTAMCFQCGRREKQHGTIESVSEWLRKLGWRTVRSPGAKPSDPSVWECVVCAKKAK